MKFCTYSSTPGLDRFPIEQRYRAWRDAHKDLMRTDLEYRQANRRFTFQMIASSIFATILIWAFSFSIGRVANHAWALGFVIVAFVAVVLAYDFLTLRKSFRMQHFMNEKVGRVLESR